MCAHLRAYVYKAIPRHEERFFLVKRRLQAISFSFPRVICLPRIFCNDHVWPRNYFKMIQPTEMTQPRRMKPVSFQISFTETSGAGSLALVMLTLAQSRGGPPGHHSLTPGTRMKMWPHLSLCLLSWTSHRSRGHQEERRLHCGSNQVWASVPALLQSLFTSEDFASSVNLWLIPLLES